MTTPTGESIISDVRRRSPQVVELAQLLAPAVRIEAALVRRLRIELLPQLPAEVEARLWFSPLVQAHSADGLALSVPIAVALRRELAEQWDTERRALLKRARTIYSDVHAYLPPPLRLEEEVAWCLIEGDPDAAEAQLAKAVAALVAEPDQFRFWAAQATVRLPDGMSMAASGTRLAQAATTADRELFGPEWETAYRALGTKALAIRHIGAQIELGGPAGPLCRRIDVPDAPEVLLELRWSSAGAVATERIAVDTSDGAPPTLTWGSGDVEVRTAAGLNYLVRDPFQRPCRVDQAADPSGQIWATLADQSIPSLRLARDDETAELAIVTQDGRVTIVDASGQPFAGVPQLDPGDDSLATLAAHVSRWLSIAELHSGSPLLAGAIEVTVAGPDTEPGQDVDLATTDRATVTITNLSSEPLFVAVLALSSDWSVYVDTWPGGPMSPGQRGESTLQLGVLGPEQHEGYVRVIGVAARDAFDPYPLTLPAISLTNPFPAAPSGTNSPGISTLDTEFAIMTGAPIPTPSAPRYLAWTTSEALVRVRAPAADTGQVRPQVRIQHGGEVYAVAFSPDGAQLATGSGDGTARVFDTATGADLVRMDHKGEVYAVAFSPDGAQLATGSGDGTARVFDAATGTERVRIDHGGEVYAVAFSPDGAQLATGSGDGTARVFDAATGTERVRIDHGGEVYAVAFSPDGTLVASAGQDGTARLWDSATGRDRDFPQGDPTVVAVVTADPDGSLVTSASPGWSAGWQEIWWGISRRILRGNLSAVVFSPDGTLVASAGRDGTARVWEVASGAPRAALRDDSGLLRAVAFSPDGTLLAAAALDGAVRLWNATTGAPRAVLRGHSGVVNTIRFSPDGAVLASAGQDGMLRLWDPASWVMPGPWSGRRVLVAIAAAAPPGLPPLAHLETDVDLLADQLTSRGLEVVRMTGQQATGTRVREMIRDLHGQAGTDGADLLVLYVAGHSSRMAAGGFEVVLADGARLDAGEFAGVFVAAQRSVVVFDVDQGVRVPDALGQAAAAEAVSSGRGIAFLASPETDLTGSSGGFAEALVAALARTSVIDDSLLSTLNERLAAGTGGRGAVVRSFGSPIVLPDLEAIPATSNGLAEQLAARGDLAGAKDVYQSTYHAERRILGADHLDTLTTASRLAGVLRALGEYQAARHLDEGNEALRRRLQDEDGVR